MASEIQVSIEQTRELIRDASEYAAHFLVSFVRFVIHGEEIDAEGAGSGTLVTIRDGRHAILTAAHVTEELPRRGSIGLVLEASPQPRIDHFSVEVQHLQLVPIAGASRTVEGPDLALVILPTPIVGRIRSRNKAFYNLESRRERMLHKPPAIELGFWGLSGVIAQWTSDMPPERAYKRVKAFHHYFRQGDVIAFVERGAFDYVTFHTRVGGELPAPTDYSGVSGGALWQALIREKDGGPELVEILLSGVVYFQSPVDGAIELACHGRRSIYEHAIKGMAAEQA